MISNWNSGDLIATNTHPPSPTDGEVDPIILNCENFPELLAMRAAAHPEKIAFSFIQDTDGLLEISYGQLHTAAAHIAADVAAKTCTGDRVLLLYPSGLDYIAAFLGCMLAGAIPVPCYPPTNKRNSGRVNNILQDCAASLILTSHGASEKLRQVLAFQRWFETSIDHFPPLLINRAAIPAKTVRPNDLAFLQYTSGSTAAPKGVMVSHRNLLVNSRQIQRAIKLERDVGITWLPPYHDMGLIGGLLRSIYSGGHTFILSPASFLQQPIRWLRAISAQHATIAGAPNFAYELCAGRITEAQKAQLDLSSWRVAFCGAEPIRAQTLERFHQAFKSCGFSREALFPCYGLAEATLIVTSAQKGAGPVLTGEPGSSDVPVKADHIPIGVSSGRPVCGQVLAIVDSKTCTRLPDGTIGEIWVAGENIANGYWGNRTLSDTVFRARIHGEPDSPPFLRTGDLGILRDGELYVAGRIKDLIILSGRNIYPQDVETASCSSHPDLRANGAAAFAIDVDGTERLIVVQELELRRQASDELFEHIASAVFDATDAQPDVIVLLKAGGLPRTSSGKVRRSQTRADFENDQLPVIARRDRHRQVIHSGTPPMIATTKSTQRSDALNPSVATIEAWLSMQLANKLRLDPQMIKSDRPFANYGVNSMLAVELSGMLSEWLKRPLEPTLLWNYPSPQLLAHYLAGGPMPTGTTSVACPSPLALSEPIAIIGLGCRFPLANDPEAFWRLISTGTDAVREVPASRYTADCFEDDPSAARYTRIGGFLEQIDAFDPHFFGIAPREAIQIDPQQRLTLEVAWEALENAAIAPSSLAGSETGVFIGISSHDYDQLQAGSGERMDLYTATGAALSIAPNRLSYLLDLHGPSLAIDTACSSSLVAVHLACQSLRSGESTLALAGGVNLLLSNQSSIPFATAGLLSTDGRCKAFDASANGYVRGEGCGVVVLKKLSDALRDGDTVRAIIAGSAISQDGRSNGITAPNGNAQATVIRRALAQAGILPGQIGYVEAHGTGTALGDPIELNALKQVLMDGRRADQPCVIGSVKTNIGHLEAAAGIAGLIKSVLLLERQTIPPNLHYHTLNPNCTLNDTPLTIATTLQSWDSSNDRRYAGISSFGFGGTIAHLILSEAPVPPAYTGHSIWPSHLLCWSAKSKISLDDMTEQLTQALLAQNGASLADVSHTLRLGRDTYDYRRMLVAADTAEAARLLSQRDDWRLFEAHNATRVPHVVFLFPGQGAQQVDMAQQLYCHLDSFRRCVDNCIKLLEPALQRDLQMAIYPADADRASAVQQINRTALAQPALFIIEYALAQLWIEWGVQPRALLGHSLGEYVAACVAGVFTLEAALKLVTIRGQLMQSMPEGAMISVALDHKLIGDYLNDGIELAAINAPHRCTLTGRALAIEALERRLVEKGITFRRLCTSHAFHSQSMDPILETFRRTVAATPLQVPQIPYISNVTGTWISADQAIDPDYWVRQLREPVRFSEGLALLTAEQDCILIEIGPDGFLSGLVRQNHACASKTILSSLHRGPEPDHDLQILLETLGRLWLAGHPVNWQAMYERSGARRVALPTYPFDRQRYWINHNKTTTLMQANMNEPSSSPTALTPSTSERQEQILVQLRDMVASLLQTTPDRINPFASLLELGADSLVLVQAVRSIENTFGVTLTIRQLFEQLTTISDIAIYLAKTTSSVLETQLTQPKTAQVDGSLIIPQTQVIASAPTAVVTSAASTTIERVIAQQLQSMTQLMTQQLSMLGNSVSTAAATMVSPPAIQSERDSGEAAAITERKSIKPPAGGSGDQPFVPYQPIRPAHLDPFGIGMLDSRQRAYLDGFIANYVQRTRKSKELTQRYRPFLSDNRAAAGFRFSIKEILYPIVGMRAEGARMWDIDGNEYIDLTMGFGVNLFGHQAPFIQQSLHEQLQQGIQVGPQIQLAGEVAELVNKLTGMKRVTFCNSGTEAITLALRLARTVTGRKKIVIFSGSFHGWGDETLTVADPQGSPYGSVSIAPGLQPDAAANTLVFEYGSPLAIDMIRSHAHELAAVLVEPVQSRRPEFQPRTFLKQLRAVTKEHGIALIFDEMITGFRLHPGGAQAWYGVEADMATYGKVIGGGMPVGLVAGNTTYLDAVDGGSWQYDDMSYPKVNTTFFAGTFCKHPLMLAAARAVLRKLVQEGPRLQEELTQRTALLVQRLNGIFDAAQLAIQAVNCGSLFRLHTKQNIDLLFYHTVARGLYIWEGRNMFLSTAHSDADIDRVVEIFESSVQDLRCAGFLSEPIEKSDIRSASSSSKGIAPTCSINPGAAARATSDSNQVYLPLWGGVKGHTDWPDDATASVAAENLQARTRDMQFSLSFFGNYDAEYRTDKYRLLFDSARFADQNDFTALWLPERHFHAFGGLSPNPVVLSAALARETKRIQLRAGSVVLPLHHPVRVAEEWSMVDNISNGRVGIALASGWHPNDFVLAPAHYGTHRERMFEQLQQVQTLWQGKALSLPDGSGAKIPIKLFPMPKQARLPIWITIVNNPDTYRRAGAIGAGILTNLMGQTIDDLQRNIGQYRQALAQHGHNPAEGCVTVLLHTFLDDDAERARAMAHEPFVRYLRSSLALFQNMVNSLGLQADVATMPEDDRDYLLNVAYKRYVESSALIGSPSSCRNVIQRLHQIGVDEIGCFIDFGVDPETVWAHLPLLNTLRQFFVQTSAATSQNELRHNGIAPAATANSTDDRRLGTPLTSAQQGIWLECQIDEDTALSYNTTTVLRMHGPLEHETLQEATRHAVLRHDALHMVFEETGQRQHKLPRWDVELTLIDFTNHDDQTTAVEQWHLENNRRRFDIGANPLMRANLLKLSAREHLFVLTFHHLVIDGISQVKLLEEIAAFYRASNQSHSAELQQVLSFDDYIKRLQAYQQSERFIQDESYWLKRFPGRLPAPLILTNSSVSSHTATCRAQQQQLVVAGDRYLRLQQLARDHGCTLCILMLASVGVWLHRLAQQEDFVIGVPMTTGRDDLDDFSLVGCTLNLVPIRCRPAGELSFIDYLGQIKSTFLDAYEHASYPFDLLIKNLNLPPDPERRSLVPILFNLDRPPGNIDFGQGPDAIRAELASSPISYSQDDLSINALQLPSSLEVTFQYKQDLFDQTGMQCMINAFETLLTSIVESPDKRIRDLAILAPALRNQILVEWNFTSADFLTDRCIHELFEMQVERVPDSPAVIFESNHLTYAQLNAKANQLARHLCTMGIGPDKFVAICLERSLDMIVALLAVLKAGGAYIPLDPAFPNERLSYMLADSEPVAILGHGATKEILTALATNILIVDLDANQTAWSEQSQENLSSAALGLKSGNAAYVIYTSGSTGNPKGVIVEHRGLVNQAEILQRKYDLQTQDRILLFSTINFDMSVEEYFGALCCGCALVIRTDEWISDSVTFWQHCNDSGVTVLNLPTIFWHQLVGDHPQVIPTGIRQISIGGEQVKPEIVAQWFCRSGHLPILFNAYGPTEATVNATIQLITKNEADATSIGGPLANITVYILDRHLQPLPVGIPGEICIGGVGVARGYLNRPAMTAELFVPDPFINSPGARMYKTGDLGRYRPDGTIEYLGRNDLQVKIRGFRIGLDEIETKLTAIPGIREAAALALEDLGGGKRLVAYIVTEKEYAIHPSALRERLAGELPEYMLPSAYVKLTALPLTANGKLDRKALAARTPAADAYAVQPYEAPIGKTEIKLAAIWAEVLGLEHVGRHDNFFALGGHSLLAIQLIGRIRAALELDIKVKVFVNAPTVAALAEQIEFSTWLTKSGLSTAPVTETDETGVL